MGEVGGCGAVRERGAARGMGAVRERGAVPDERGMFGPGPFCPAFPLRLAAVYPAGPEPIIKHLAVSIIVILVSFFSFGGDCVILNPQPACRREQVWGRT